MNARKLAASLVIGSVFAVQLFAFTIGRGGWYWPFVDYPMYSEAKRPGATFGVFDLEVVGCNGVTRALQAHELRMPAFRYRNVLEVAAGGRPDRAREPDEIPRARDVVTRVIREELPGDWCSARVHGRIYTVGKDGLESAEVPRRLLAEWPIGGGPAS